MLELDDYAFKIINKRYNVLFSIDCRNFDLNIQELSTNLNRIKKKVFSPNDRIVLVHMDTDYYDEQLSQGLLIINLLRVFKNEDIPMYTLLFVTNHFGISKEFDTLLKDHDIDDRPTIIETLLSKALLSDKFKTSDDFEFDSIEKSGICMMGSQRSHRIALCNFLINNQLLPYVALKTNFK